VEGSIVTFAPGARLPALACDVSIPIATPPVAVASSEKVPPLASKMRSPDRAGFGMAMEYDPSVPVVTGPATTAPDTDFTVTDVPLAGPAMTTPEMDVVAVEESLELLQPNEMIERQTTSAVLKLSDIVDFI
jgi:hypothetical protein